jgi:hypothetical protein
MTATKNEKTKKYIDLSNCVETNLSSGDRFIFAIDHYDDRTVLDIKVLGKPPYKHD